jgi:hypothetical protein
MKTALIGAVFVVCAGLLSADEGKHPHGHVTPGPKGGRLLDKTDPKAEFLMEKDRTVTIHFYDAKLKPVAATGQAVTVLADSKPKAKVEFEKKGDVLVSKTKLPEGDPYNLVLQFQASPTAKVQNHRFKLDLSTCAGCNRVEYTCTCHE